MPTETSLNGMGGRRKLTEKDFDNIGKELELLLPVVMKLAKLKEASKIDLGLFEVVEIGRLRRLAKLLDRLVSEGYSVYARENGDFKIGPSDSKECREWADFTIPP